MLAPGLEDQQHAHKAGTEQTGEKGLQQEIADQTGLDASKTRREGIDDGIKTDPSVDTDEPSCGKEAKKSNQGNTGAEDLLQWEFVFGGIQVNRLELIGMQTYLSRLAR